MVNYDLMRRAYQSSCGLKSGRNEP